MSSGFLWNQSTVSSFSKETRSGGAVYIFKSEMCLIEINCLTLSSQKCVVICTRVGQKCEKVVISFEHLNLWKQNLVLLMVLFWFSKIERINFFSYFCPALYYHHC